MRARRPKGLYTGSGSTNLYLTIVFIFANHVVLIREGVKIHVAGFCVESVGWLESALYLKDLY